jgi:hypothetical protein
MGWWRDIWKTRSKRWLFAPLASGQVPDHLAQEQLNADSVYLNIFLRSMRVTDIRKGLSKFYGTVHSNISVPYFGSHEPAEFQVVLTPTDLKNRDVKHLDRVININRRLLGPIPYRGGDIEFEIGLFSIKSADLAGPFVSVLERMSSAAGVSFISTAMPFIGPLKDGINLLTGGADDAILEIGLARTFNRPSTGYFFIMRAQRGALDPKDLKVDDDFHLVDKAGKSIGDYPYLVLAIEASKQRDDWFRIPDLAASYATIQSEVHKGNLIGVQEAFATFRRKAMTSADLLADDAVRLVEKVEKSLEQVMQASLTSKRIAKLPKFSSIRLYD